MRSPALLLIAGLAGCTSVANKVDPLGPDIVQEAGLGDAILNSGDPTVAVAYFEGAVARQPERADLRRSLARSYARAGRHSDALAAFGTLVAMDAATPEDLIAHGMIAVRLGAWETAARAAAALPDDFASPRQALLTALLADHAQDWEAADRAYALAAESAPGRARALNNWGVSRMARGDLPAAAETFAAAVAADPSLFAAKNNLAIARAMTGQYAAPNLPLSDLERALVLKNMGLVAERRGSRGEARRLYRAAVDAHPRHFGPAMDRLAALGD